MFTSIQYVASKVLLLLLVFLPVLHSAWGEHDGAITMEKRHEFPLGFYALPEDDAALQAMADAGVNLVRCRDRADLDRLQALGMKGVMPLPFQNGATDALSKQVAGLVDHPALAVWEGPDEIVWNFTAFSGLFRTMGIHSVEGAWWKQTPEAVAYAEEKAAEIIPNMRAAVAMIRELDTQDRPVWINEAQSSDTYYVRQYLDFVDITGCDIYPVKKGKRELERIGYGVERWLKVGRGKPVYMVLQAFSWNELGDYYGVKDTAYPSFAESRFMAYDSIVRGASGILYWGSQFLKSDDFRQSIYALISELSVLQPFLVAAPHPVTITLTDMPEDPPAVGNVFATVRQHEEDWLIIVVNEDSVKHMGVVLEGMGIPDGTVFHELYGTSSRTVTHGEFIPSLLPYDVKVFCTNRQWETERRDGRDYIQPDAE